MKKFIKKLEELNKRIEILRTAIHSSEDELMNNGFNIQTFENRYFLSLPTQGGLTFSLKFVLSSLPIGRLNTVTASSRRTNPLMIIESIVTHCVCIHINFSCFCIS